MIDAFAVERMLALAAIAPFDHLKESELLLVAQQTQRRIFASGDTVFPAGQVPEVMIVPTSGSALIDGERRAAIIGASSILFGTPLGREIVAGPEGMEALCLAKPHLFTLARECPGFIVGVARLGCEVAE